jgi:16S rRNA A1518/A1519 N6-dimethyltransferase RsmA/KsgA/DIM1 with predicted DNA glycosylase/AP lyase activity
VENEEAFLSFLKAIYTHKGKKLRNALVDSRNMLEIEKEEIKGLRDESPHSEKRVYQLNIREMTEVFDWFQSEF